MFFTKFDIFWRIRWLFFAYYYEIYLLRRILKIKLPVLQILDVFHMWSLWIYSSNLVKHSQLFLCICWARAFRQKWSYEAASVSISGWPLRCFLRSQTIFGNISLLKMMKNAFHFTSEVFFVLKIFKFLSWLFSHVRKQLD